MKDMFRQLSEVKTAQGLLHDYLGMTLDCSMPGQVSIDMSHYVKKIIKEFPPQISREHQWPHHGMKTSSRYNTTVVFLEKEQAKPFHTVTMQGLFLCKCGNLDIAPAIAY